MRSQSFKTIGFILKCGVCFLLGAISTLIKLSKWPLVPISPSQLKVILMLDPICIRLKVMIGEKRSNRETSLKQVCYIQVILPLPLPLSYPPTYTFIPPHPSPTHPHTLFAPPPPSQTNPHTLLCLSLPLSNPPTYTFCFPSPLSNQPTNTFMPLSPSPTQPHTLVCLPSPSSTHLHTLLCLSPPL